ncbi:MULTISPECIES: AMP-binding protein [Chryseobacterium]|uniref:Amino acid adenylation domain-containing protein n=1 Tax=Chryseobacterium geocarposphaerae TaxID=1416776 RepID=A0ABU1LF69_9FLAO|nr:MULTISPECIES: AMP-binding protein [Chryseobacterium]MDR6405368.1 amino acid adenylation domain-containing protein [Chryseobacterium geocarposphaerae]MDR6697527.1 amino acid adenylation domain-containing protein [Chryseobacterium ginsenosidimutans]
MNSFIENLYQSFLQHKANTCISIEDKNYSYEDVLNISHQIRHQLQSINSQNIGIYLTDDVFMYASILAIWFEGKTYVPIHPDFPLTKNLNVIQQADIDTVLSSIEIKENLDITIIDTQKNFEVKANSPKESSLTNNAYILFTSGSTGNPKGVPIQFSNLYYFSESFHAAFGKLSPQDSVLQMFELTFDLSVMSYLVPFLNGAKVVGLHKKETKFLQILDLLEANEITVALMVPSILNLIIPYLDPSIQNESLRLNLFCGEALLVKQIEGWKNFIPNAAIYNVYGPTENTIFCTQYKVETPIKERKGIISIGKSMENSSMSFLEDNTNEGELLLSGKFLTQSYWKNEEKTNEAFIEKDGKIFYKTGDWCLKDEDGDYYYINRIDFQAKINGFRVELSEIEYFANQKLENAISVAVIHKDKNDNDNLILFINNIHSNEEEINAHLKNNLPDYCIPSKIFKLEKFPTNTSGKIDRNELKKTLL